MILSSHRWRNNNNRAFKVHDFLSEDNPEFKAFDTIKGHETFGNRAILLPNVSNVHSIIIQ